MKYSVLMIPYSIDFFIAHYRFSLFLTSVTSLSLGVFVLIRNARSLINRTFAIFMVFIATWSCTQALIGTWPDPSLWLSFARVEHYGHVFIPSVFLHFVHAVIGLRRPRRLFVSYAISFLCFCLVPTTLFIRYVDLHAYAKFALHAGPIYPIYMVWFIVTVVEALVKLRVAINNRSSQPIEQLKLKYIFWATFIGYAGGLPNFLYVYGIDAYPIIPFSTYLVPIYPVVIAYAIVRHQVLDIRVAIRKSLVYSLLAATITGIYFSFVLVAEKLLQGMMGYRSIIGSLVAGFVITLGFTPLKEFVQHFIDQVFSQRSQASLVKENERLRQEIGRSEKLKAIATLTAGMAHEIKNPLASIKTFAEYLPQKYDDPVFREKFAKIMSMEVDKMNALVQRLLEFARPTPPQLQPVYASQLLQETLEFLQGTLVKQHIAIETEFAETDSVLVDPGQMKQVFLNVLLNSIEAMDPPTRQGGGMNQPGRLSVATQQHNGYVEVKIADTGPGIPKKDLQRVFDPFYTTKANGTGLGLSVVHSIVREHGGRVVIHSELGEGTTVAIHLPRTGGTNGTSTHPHCG